MALNIGLNVVEVDGSAPATIQGAATSVAAFVISTRRGTPNRPVRVTSFAQFTERFGGFSAGSVGAYLVRGFFENGGQFAYVNRVGGRGANAAASASATISTGPAAGQQLITLTAGFRGAPDPGPWGNDLRAELVPSFSTTIRPAGTIAAGGTTLTSVAGFSPQDVIVLSDGTDRATVTVQTINASTGAVTWAPNLTNAGDFDAATTTVASSDFTLRIDQVRDGVPVTVETWERLTLRRVAANYAVTVLNDPLRGSKYVTVTDARAATETGAASPGRSAAVTLANGTGGTVDANDFIGDAAGHTGLRALDALDVQLVATERTDPAVVIAALAYCEGRGDCMFVGAVPEATVGAGTAIDYGAQFQGKKVYGALYGPWITVTDPLSAAVTPVRSVPPTGHVMGVYARVETARGIHKAPAGDEARVLGALDVEYRLSDAELTDLVKTGSVNGIRVVPGAGIVVDSSRTLSTDVRWLYVNVRLLFNYVKSSLRQGLRWVRQEPNRDTLWTAVTYGSVRPFLLGLWRQGAFGTGEPDDVFTIICDETNNPPDEVDKGNFAVEVYFYPSKPAETVVITVGQQPSRATATES
jgi:phage tail sheath protein FI